MYQVVLKLTSAYVTHKLLHARRKKSARGEDDHV